MGLAGKIVPLAELSAWRESVRNRGLRLVVTNGCFDILHAGHVNYLEAARHEGDCLLVGLNSDASVRQLKGEGRPVNSEGDRAIVLAALSAVDAVCIFPEVRATRLLRVAQPDVYVKGGDFQVDDLPLEEREVVAAGGGKIVTLGLLPGRSTSTTLKKMAGL